MFTHFGKAVGDSCMSHAFMFMALCCNMAISCQACQGCSMRTCAFLSTLAETSLSRKTTSWILVSIKDKADGMGVNGTFVDINELVFVQDEILHPFIPGSGFRPEELTILSKLRRRFVNLVF